MRNCCLVGIACAFTMTVICDANKTGLELSFNFPPSAFALSDDSYRVAHGAAPGPTYVDAVATLNPLNEKPSLTELRRPRGQTGIQEILVHCHRRKNFLFKRSSKEALCCCPLMSSNQVLLADVDAQPFSVAHSLLSGLIFGHLCLVC